MFTVSCGRLPQLLKIVFSAQVDVVRLLSILMWHAPSQFRLRRRRQPSWWTPACMAAYIARNGAWPHHRRSQSPEDRARFRAARLAFHRVVRSAQRAYWTQWQDCVSTLSLSNPRQAASAVRRAFQGTNRDVSSQVRWPASSHPLPVEESLAHWRDHFATVGASSDASYDEDFFRFIGRRFAEISSSCRSTGIFDALFTHSALRRALSHCIDSAVGLDGLPYSLFKVNFPWWQDAILNFYNLVFSWSAVPTLWKRSVIVPVFKRGDPSQATNYRPISLASCCFKVLEHMVLSRIGPHICPQLDESQGGFRWGADCLVGSLVSVLSSRSSSHTFVAFIDIQKAFDTSWVEGTLVRLFDPVSLGCMWRLLSHFLLGTQSQVRSGDSLSAPWTDTGIA